MDGAPKTVMNDKEDECRASGVGEIIGGWKDRLLIPLKIVYEICLTTFTT